MFLNWPKRCALALCLALVVQTGAAAAAPAAVPEPSITVQWANQGGASSKSGSGWTAEARGVPADAIRAIRKAAWTIDQWQKLFPIFAEQGDLAVDAVLPPMLGEYRVAGDRLIFRPHFPLQAGVSYRAVLRPSALPAGFGQPAANLVSASHRLPTPPATPRASVTGIFPSADELPENLLKFYLQFSHPMSGGQIYEHIHLLDEHDRAVELPFLEIDEELWDPPMQRLTLFIDPGRIKRGVAPLEDIGPALLSGHRYTLVIDAAWRDAEGAPLKATYRKSFRIGPPNRAPIVIQDWKLQVPPATTTEPLVIAFDRSLDWALARRVIAVRRGARGGESIAGEVRLEKHETIWRFTPARAWRRGPHELLVQNTLEDLAGNNIGKSFEVDLFDGVQRRITNATVRVPFEVK